MSGTVAVSGVILRPLQRIEDARGALMHMIRADALHFEQFGEVYFSLTRPGVVKAWRRHQRSTSNLAVPVGSLRIVIFDDRVNSPTRGGLVELELGESNYCLLTIPSGLWTGWMNPASTPALMANCATLPHAPSEVDQLDANTNLIPYRWPT